MYCIDQEQVGRLTVRVFQDEDCYSPLENDRLGTILMFHSHYNLGDKPAMDLDAAREFCEQSSQLSFPVFMYVHSGIALSTESFVNKAPHAYWDSGRVGWITVSKEKVKQEYSYKILGKKIKEQVYKVLSSEIKEYGQWLNGECWGYEVVDEDGEVLDSCWGFIGDLDVAMKDGIEAAQGILTKEK